MEEVSTDDQQEVTGKVSDLKIANQLQEAAQTNVTQAQGKQLSLQGSILKGTKRQQSGQMGQNIKN